MNLGIRGKLFLVSLGLIAVSVFVTDLLVTSRLVPVLIVDDYQMRITHVLRGEERLSSAPKHILLYRFLGYPLPHFAHLPLTLNPDRSKLSRRQGDVAVEDYRDHGFFSEALVNFIAFLGWSPGHEREILTIEELTQSSPFSAWASPSRCSTRRSSTGSTSST